MQTQSVQIQQDYVPLPLRTHNILGVCEGIGEDFGFNPIILRVILAAGVLVNAEIAIGAYFALGAVVLASRLLFPRPRVASGSAVAAQADNDEAGREVSIAA